MAENYIKFISSSLFAILFALSIRACSLPSFSYNALAEKKSAEEIKKIIDSPKKAYNYLKAVYSQQSFCVDTARLGCYMISDDDYTSMPMLFNRSNECHCICVFRDKENDDYGFFDNGIWGYQKARFDSVLKVADYIKSKKGFRMLLFSKNSLIKNEDYSSNEGLESLIRMLDADKREIEILNKKK